MNNAGGLSTPALRHDERGRGAVAEERRVRRGVRPVRLDEGRLERPQLLQGGVPLHAVLDGASIHGDDLEAAAKSDGGKLTAGGGAEYRQPQQQQQQRHRQKQHHQCDNPKHFIHQKHQQQKQQQRHHKQQQQQPYLLVVDAICVRLRRVLVRPQRELILLLPRDPEPSVSSDAQQDQQQWRSAMCDV